MHHSRRPAGFSRPDLHDWLVEHDPLVLVADRNDVLEALWHDPRFLAAESAWLHRLGPSAFSAHRRLVTFLDAIGDGHAVPLKALASELGLPGGDGRNAKVVKTLARLVDYGIATPRDGALAITFALPPTGASRPAWKRRSQRRPPPPSSAPVDFATKPDACPRQPRRSRCDAVAADSKSLRRRSLSQYTESESPGGGRRACCTHGAAGPHGQRHARTVGWPRRQERVDILAAHQGDHLAEDRRDHPVPARPRRSTAATGGPRRRVRPVRQTPLISALGYAERGWAVFPRHEPASFGCNCGRSSCASPAKHPRTAHGLHDATTNLATIRGGGIDGPTPASPSEPAASAGSSFSTWTSITTAFRPCTNSNASTVRCHPVPPSAPAAAAVTTGLPIPAASSATSPAVSAGASTSAATVANVIAPPSRHITGGRYLWASEMPLAPAPGWLRTLCQ